MKTDDVFPKKDWHEDQGRREAVGFDAEAAFQNQWRCRCGSYFVKMYAGNFHGTPDFQCPKCGQLVEVKSNTKKRECDNVSISQYPFDNYPPETILAYYNYDKKWIGAYRRDAVVSGGPYPPAHAEKGTPYYWVSLNNFVPLIDFGLVAK